MTNIAELLKDAPTGMKLYSPLFGVVEYMQLGDDDKIWIKVDNSEPFDKYGRYFGSHFNDAECLLFPSKKCRTWKGWTPPTIPKFKIGDWIVSDDKQRVYQITDMSDNSYFYDYSSKYDLISVADKSYHLWSINDAKDGDVLMTTNIRNCPFIYRKTDYKNNLAYYYAGIDGNGNFCEGCLKRTLYHFGPVSDVVPATKEQRELLFAKMKEAGYEWDAENKELKKIPKHYDIANFKPFDKVLVRDGKEPWRADFFEEYDDNFYCFRGAWEQCIPFNGDTKHLLGTTDMPSEEFINW